MDDKFGRNFEFPVRLAAKGHQVLVVAIDYKGKPIEQKMAQGVEIISIPIFSLRALKGINMCIKSIRDFQPSHIIGSGDSHFGYLAILLAKKMKAYSVFDVYDHYLSFGSNRLPMMKAMFFSSIRKANLVLCASSRLAELAQLYNQNVIILENGVDTNRFKPMDKGYCRNRLGIKNNDEIIVGYFGSMEPMRGVEYLVKACQSLQTRYPHLRLLIAGRQSKSIELKENFIDYRGQVSQDQIVEMINASDVLAIPYLPSSLVDYGNSCKIGEYLACNVPIVATQVDNLKLNYPEVMSVIADAVVTPANVTALESAIIMQLDQKKIVACPTRIYWSELCSKLEKVLLDLGNEPKVEITEVTKCQK